MENPKFERVLFWFIAIALFIALSCISHIALAQEIDVGNAAKLADPTIDNIVKYGGSITVSGLLIIGIYQLFKYLIEHQKQAKENEKQLEQRIVHLEGEKTNLQKDHITMLEKQGDKFIALLKESHQNNDRVLKEYLLESEKNRHFMAAEYEKQRLFYEKIYSEMMARYNTNK
jgi:hypothetical protein